MDAKNGDPTPRPMIPPLLKPIVAGALTGALESFVTYPTEFVKTNLQLQDKANPKYSGIVDCYFKTVRNDGFLGLYRGMTPILVGSIPKQATRWGTYEWAVSLTCAFKRDVLLMDADLCTKQAFGLLELSLCGLVAGSVEALVAVVPTETVKTRLIDDQRSAAPKYRGVSFPVAVSRMVRDEGISGVYKGVTSTVTKQAINQCVRFPVQQATMNVLCGVVVRDSLLTERDLTPSACEERLKELRRRFRSSPAWNGFAGFVAGIASVMMTQPFDVVKTRMQGAEAARYSSTLDCCRSILTREGARTFYAGSVPRMMRVGGNVALTFTIFPLVKKLL